METMERSEMIHKRWQIGLLYATNAINSERPKSKGDGYHCYTDQREIDICLNCKRKRCTGGDGCFAELRKAKKEL